MADHLDISGAFKKIEAAKALRDLFVNLHRDAVSYFQFKLTEEILNLPNTAEPGRIQGRKAIRRITGILVASIGQTFKATESILFFNASIAPYVFKVFEYAKERYGQTPIQLVMFFYADYVRKTMRETVVDAFKAINDNVNYKYYNPFG